MHGGPLLRLAPLSASAGHPPKARTLAQARCQEQSRNKLPGMSSFAESRLPAGDSPLKTNAACRDASSLSVPLCASSLLCAVRAGLLLFSPHTCTLEQPRPFLRDPMHACLVLSAMPKRYIHLLRVSSLPRLANLSVSLVF